MSISDVLSYFLNIHLLKTSHFLVLHVVSDLQSELENSFSEKKSKEEFICFTLKHNITGFRSREGK